MFSDFVAYNAGCKEYGCYSLMFDYFNSISLYWFFVSLFTICDILQPSWYMKYKTQKSHIITNQRLIENVLTTLYNQFIIAPFLFVIWYDILKWRGLSQIEPTFMVYLTHMIVYVLALEVFFYIFHRFLHLPYVYKNVHKVHHDEPQSIALSTLNNHPIEYILTGFIAVNIGHLIMGSHIKVFYFWYFGGSIASIVFHCGVHFPILIPNEFHDYHHMNPNECFSAFGIIDSFMKSNKMFKKSLHYQREKFYSPSEHYPQTMDEVHNK